MLTKRMSSEIMNELNRIERVLKKSKNEWEWKVANLIKEIPEGHIITYGTLAEWVNLVFSLNIVSRNTANLRRKLYRLLADHNPALPLHRIAKKGDLHAKKDSDITRPFVEKRRREEGSWITPKWFHPFA